MKIFFLIASILVGVSFYSKQDDTFQFGQFVKFSETCTGNIRNSFGFGFYHVDNIECRYADKDKSGILSKNSKIISEKNLTLLYWQSDCTLGKCYTPVIGNGQVPEIEACHKRIDQITYQQLCNYPLFYKDTNGSWKQLKIGQI